MNRLPLCRGNGGHSAGTGSLSIGRQPVTWSSLGVIMPAETVAAVGCCHLSLFLPVVALRLGISVGSVSSDWHPRLSHVVAMRLSDPRPVFEARVGDSGNIDRSHSGLRYAPPSGTLMNSEKDRPPCSNIDTSSDDQQAENPSRGYPPLRFSDDCELKTTNSQRSSH